MLGPTDPNRYYMWTGWDGNDGQGGGPVIANDELGYGWQTYPERLQAAGISWKIYQDIGNGLDEAGAWGFTSDPYIGNYGDNSLLYFFDYQNAAPGSPLYQRARTGTNVNQRGGFFDILEADVKGGRLPKVSWIVAPEAYTEHPAWPAGYGAWYTAGVLNALTSDPEVWSKTALLITFDENDGFFDHVVGALPQRRRPATASRRCRSTTSCSTARPERPAARTGCRTVRTRRARAAARRLAVEPGRLGVLGDVRPHVADPVHRGAVRRRRAQHHSVAPGGVRRPDLGVRLPERIRSRPSRCPASPPTSRPEHRSAAYHPTPPAVGSVPNRSRGCGRRAGSATAFRSISTPSLVSSSSRSSNRGRLGVDLQARSMTVAGAPYSYTVGAGHKLAVGLDNPGTYDLNLHGQNGFFRHFAGSPQDVAAGRRPHRRRRWQADRAPHRRRPSRRTPRASSRGRRRRRIRARPPHQSARDRARSRSTPSHSGGWYDIALSTPERRELQLLLAGRLESGDQLTSDPQLGRS